MKATRLGTRSLGLIAFALLLAPALAFTLVALPLSAGGQPEHGLLFGGLTFLVFSFLVLGPVLLSSAVAFLLWKPLRNHRFVAFLSAGGLGTLLLVPFTGIGIAALVGFLPSAIVALLVLDYRNA